MRGTKVRPMVEVSLLDSAAGDATMLLDESDESDQLPQMRSGRHDYQVRQAFLRSYQFSVEETFKEKIKRLFKEINGATKAIVVDIRNEVNELAKKILGGIRHEASTGRICSRVSLIRLPVSALVPIQCFSPRRV